LNTSASAAGGANAELTPHSDEQMTVEDAEENDESDEEDDEEEEEPVDEKLESLSLKKPDDSDPFTLSYSAQPVKDDANAADTVVVMQNEQAKNAFIPHARRSSYLQFHKGVLYMYGGKYEDDNEKEFTFNDMYALNLKKLDEWKILFEDKVIHAEIQKSKASKLSFSYFFCSHFS
jgi:hypothetical protein